MVSFGRKQEAGNIDGVDGVDSGVVKGKFSETESFFFPAGRPDHVPTSSCSEWRLNSLGEA